MDKIRIGKLVTAAFCTLALVTLAASRAVAEETTLARCAAIRDSGKRLACYDALSKRSAKQDVQVDAKIDKTWEYAERVDKMTDQKVRTASTKSKNTLEFSAPYEGTQRAVLMLRHGPDENYDVMIAIQKGQFLCHVDSCGVQIRFDDNKPAIFRASPPSDHSTTMLFIENELTFLRKLSQAKRLLVGADFFHQGSRLLEFDVEGLEWEIPPLMASGKECRATFDCPTHEKCDKKAKKCVLCDNIGEGDVCQDPGR
jgi:hypothetical protein